MVQSLRHEIAGFIEVNPEGGKVSRAAAASPQLESGNWYLPHPMLAPWVEEFLGECAAFPAGAHDDQVDAWSQGAKRLIHIKPQPPAPLPRPRYRYSHLPNQDSWMLRATLGAPNALLLGSGKHNQKVDVGFVHALIAA